MAGPDAALINSRIPKLVGEGDDHVFVVIGRREGSDVSKARR